MVTYRSISPVLVSHLYLLPPLILTSILLRIVSLSSLTKDEWSGTYTYVCTPHEVVGMKGAIHVELSSLRPDDEVLALLFPAGENATRPSGDRSLLPEIASVTRTPEPVPPSDRC
ncbi:MULTISPECIES: plastocyanin/azurin family copper-binding protein [Halorubrum]|nr:MULTISPECIES: plastocyanin/azurin family copper-binding protein [Halorubrum]